MYSRGTGKRLLHGCCSWTSWWQARAFLQPCKPICPESNDFQKLYLREIWREAGKRWGSDIIALSRFTEQELYVNAKTFAKWYLLLTNSQSMWMEGTCRVLKALLSKERRCGEEDGVGHHAVISNLTSSVQKTHWHVFQNIKMNSSLFHVMFNHTLVFNSVKYTMTVDGFMQGS